MQVFMYVHICRYADELPRYNGQAVAGLDFAAPVCSASPPRRNVACRLWLWVLHSVAIRVVSTVVLWVLHSVAIPVVSTVVLWVLHSVAIRVVSIVVFCIHLHGEKMCVFLTMRSTLTCGRAIMSF
jgi:hypothetical protein